MAGEAAESGATGRAPKPRVSVVMAAYNCEKYLHTAIESVLKQSYRDFELLVIDDGSTDASRAIAQQYAGIHPESVRCLEHPGKENHGPAAARNVGLSHARGTYVAILDADDISEPQRLERQAAFLDAHPAVALVGSWYTAIDDKGKRIRRGKAPCDHLDIAWALLFYSPFVHSSVMFRRQVVLEQLGGYDERWPPSEDYELWTRIVQRWPVANLAEYLVRWRIHPASLTAHAGSRAQLGHRMRVDRLADRMGWQDQPFRLQEQRLAAMSHLWVGSTKSLQVDDMIQATADLFRLHHAFCHEYALAEEQARRREEALRVRVAENLTVAAMSFRRMDRVRDLLGCAIETHRPSVLRGRTAFRAGKRLVGTLLKKRPR
jgi:hypothetical protein